MPTPFPGMDPYLEHPVLWEGFHARLINAIAEHLQPQLDPRYITSIEERVFIEGPQQRIPDVWISRGSGPSVLKPSEPARGSAVVLDVEELEVHESRVEILDTYSELRLVCALEVLSPSNKRFGPGQEAYLAKQREFLSRNCHLMEIDLLRSGDRVLSIPNWKLLELGEFSYIGCVNRYPKRNRFVVYPIGLKDPLPTVAVPLAEPDPDVSLDLRAVLDHAYDAGRYGRRLKYADPCEPALTHADQEWANSILRGVPKTDRAGA